MVLDDDRSGRDVVVALDAADFLVPALLSGPGVKRYQVPIRCAEVQPVLVHGHTPVAGVLTAAAAPEVVPYFVAGPGVHGPRMIRRAEVEDAVHEQRRRHQKASERLACKLEN